MSHESSPALISNGRYPSPSSSASYVAGTLSPAPSSASIIKPRSKPVNVFTNDGSFLERFQGSKKGEEEKHKQEETMKRKMGFEDRFKNRGKRPRLDTDESTASSTIPKRADSITASPVSPTAGHDDVNYTHSLTKKEPGSSSRIPEPGVKT